MARITFVKAARVSKKERKCYRCGHVIEAGESYKHASYKTSPYSSTTRNWCAKCHPRASETTMNSRLSTLYAAQEAVEDLLAGEWTYDDLASALEDAANDAESVAEEYRESANNLEEHFSGSSQIDEINEKADAVDEWVQTLQSAAEQVRGFDNDFVPVCAECGKDEDDPLHEENNEDEEAHDYEATEDEGLEQASSAAEDALSELSL